MQPRGHAGRPILRRGPQRAVQDAVTVLGNIPILQPQQAALTSVDDAGHVSDAELAQSTVDDTTSTALTPSPRARNGGLVAPPASPASPKPGTIQLPWRPRPDRQELDMRVTSDEQAEDASHTPRNQTTELAILDSFRAVDLEQSTQSSMQSTPGLRGGGDAPGAHTRDITQNTAHSPSLSHQTRRLGSPAQQAPLSDPTKSSSSSTGQPTLYLRGYVARTPGGAQYRFRERLPHSEPRRSSSRQTAVARSLSSGAAPAGATRPSQSPDAASDDVFGTSEAPRASRRDSYNVFNPDHCVSAVSNLSSTLGGSQQAGQAGTRPRQSSSEATNASAVYSWYGSLPSETRFPSSEHSAQNEACSHAPRSDGSTYSYVVGCSPHGLSPLPSMPYTRIHNEPASSPPAASYVGGVSEGYVEAAIAAANELQSPLDPYAEHYQRQLEAQHAQPYFGAYAHPSVSSVGGAQARRPSHGQGIRPDNAAVFRQAPQRPSEHPAYSATYSSHAYARMEQRSSENAPVVGRFEGDGARPGQVQMQRAAYEGMQNAGRTTYYSNTRRGVATGPSRHSAPQSSRPYDVSNRGGEYAMSDGRASTGLEHHDHGSSTALGRPQPRQAAHAPPRVYGTARGGLGLHPARDSPVTGVAFAQGSGMTSRRGGESGFVRASSTRASVSVRTRRRVPRAQREQENDDEAGVMRREEGSVRARHGEEAQRAMLMNETPPRVGRVERRML
ncbi:uncharacterized protein SETTUDRAFT_162598 [Exserohilum turcica Et28A]|uniref:Uncharacterized protein n=1 Tax=Exserohilum turcicum (strain 28A) TaxID=671987 RepID=R0KSZ2_EXST2|nr:uncharacterized protein SETTUDRAFT_162598 [Exserohilum turcica Et28A]EOA92079.1 hypothetical protein SETTUDRAFT_162598 [Exserohilum turcica Et28A]